MVFDDIYNVSMQLNSVLDYTVNIQNLPPHKQNYEGYYGDDYYSVAGIEITLKRKMTHYIISWYLPSGIFVIVSWISFLVPPEIVPGRMALLITVLLLLVNNFNSITAKIPKADRLTSIETYIIVCIFFVFATLLGRIKSYILLNYTTLQIIYNFPEYAGILLQMKIKMSTNKPHPKAVN